MKKIKQFLNNKREYFIGSLCIICVYFIFLAIAGIWPFGQNTVARYDAYYQTTQFLGFIFDAIEGNATLIYSNLFAGGANIVGIWLYFALNPFLGVALIFGRANMYFAINIMYLLYFLLIYNVFNYFLRKKFSTLKDYQRIIISFLYTFAGYTLCNNSIIVWLNFLVLLPLLVLAFEKLINQNKIWGFSIITALFIYSSYAVGSSLQILLIFVYFLYIFIVVETEKCKKAVLNLIVGLFCGLLMSLIILIPSLLQLRSSYRLSNQSNDNLFITLYHVPTSIMFYLFQSLVLIIAIWHLIKSQKNNKMDKFLLIAIILNMIMIFFEDIPNFIAGGSVYHFSTRFYCVSQFLIFIALARAFTCKNNEKTQPLEIRKTLSNNTLIYSFVLLFILLLLFIVNFVCKEIGNSLLNGELLWKELPVYLLIPLVIIATCSLVYLFYRNKKITAKVFNVLVLSIMCVECLISGFIVFANKSETTDEVRAFYTLTNDIPANTRVLSSINLDANATLISGVSNYSVFSSCSENSTAMLTNYLAFDNAEPCIRNVNGTLFSELFLGFEYKFTDENLNDVSYLTLVSSYEGYNLYKYNYTFPRAFVVDNFDLEVNSQLHYTERLNLLAKELGSQSDLFSSNGTITAIELLNDQSTDENNYYTISFIPDENGLLYLNHTVEKCLINFKLANGEYRKLNAGRELEYTEVCAGETYNFEVIAPKDVTITKTSFEFSILNLNSLEELCNLAQENSVNITYNKNGYVLSCEDLHNSNILVIMSNPKGMEFTSNNETFSLKSVLYDLTYLENVNSEHITAEFVYPYTSLTLICGISAIILAIVISIVFYKKRHLFDFFEKPAYICFILIIVVLTFYYYTCASFSSIIKSFLFCIAL